MEQDPNEKRSRPRRKRNTAVRNYDDIRVIRRLAALGARVQAIRMALGGQWTSNTVAMVTRGYLGRVDPPGRPLALNIETNFRDRAHWTLVYLIYEISSCWPRGVPDTLADAYELYAFTARHLSETRIAIESCAPFVGDITQMGLQLGHCRECGGPRLLTSHQLRSQFLCENCTPKAKGWPGASRSEDDA